MATSCSDDTRWTAGAYLFSGRADPLWTLDATAADRLIEIWRALPRSDATAREEATRLGYRGCYLSNGCGERWIADGELVRYENDAATADTRVDAARIFERAVLRTAPPGAIPPGLIEALES